jgi:anaerobic dimethyl sulfoxide reductase subunit B (iron-sulfur subunit)
MSVLSSTDIFPDLLTTDVIVDQRHTCYHCAQPVCVKACPVQAISKRKEDGIVVVDRDLCLGKDKCDRCLRACPYKAPQFGAEENPKMQKCDFCLDRWAEGKQPICVAGCPMRALDAGPLEAMETKYGRARQATGFKYSERIQPAVVFRPKVETAAETIQ